VVVVARRPPSGAPPLGALLPDARPSDGPAADVPGPGVPEPGAPLSARRWMIKRVAASPGDPVPAGLGPALTREAGRPVPKDRYIVLGDNTDHSHDSRHTGFVERADILGVAVRRLTPRTPRATSSPRRR
ncbi:S26 family signal peptidase, partial [Streptomyces clavuligerus]